jgi:hypothetical protein
MTESAGPINPMAAWPKFLRAAESPGARTHIKSRLMRIKEAHRAGDRKELRFLVQKHLTSYDARLAATRLAYSRMHGARRPEQHDLKSIAETLNAYQGTQEAVALILIPKGNGQFRPTMDFGIQNRALQYLVLSVLYAIAELHPYQFATRGGVPAAIARVAKAIKAGNLYTAEIDIKDFYPSFDGTKLADLIPLPKRVIERVLLSEHLNIVASTIPTLIQAPFGHANADQEGVLPPGKYVANARRGFPQGSGASPTLAEMLLARVLHHLPPRGEVVAYADNILLMARNESDLALMTESLRIALEGHPAGQLWPKINNFPLGGPIGFLGHQITTHDDRVCIQRTVENTQKFESRMTPGLLRLEQLELAPEVRRSIVRELKSDLSSHVSNFRLCDDIETYRQHWWMQIMSASNKGTNSAQSKQSPTERMVFWPHPDQKEIIAAALDLAKEMVPTKHQTVALEAICQHFMGSGLAFTDWKDALRHARHQAKDKAAFVLQALGFIEELCPDLLIDGKITVKENT